MLLPKRGFYHPVAILVLAAITLSFAVIFYLNSSVFFKAPEPTTTPTIAPSTAFATQEECESKTNKVCSVSNCDYVPQGKSIEEVCGKGYKKGWKPTTQNLPINSSETESWKTYRNEDAKFQIKYPPEWELKFLDESGNPDSTLVGKEGKIQFIWGEGLGGGCDRDFENITLKNGPVPSCHIVDDQTEMWVGFTPDNTSVDTRAYVSKPLEANRTMVLKILETYESVE